jgi:hypothetical protein
MWFPRLPVAGQFSKNGKWKLVDIQFFNDLFVLYPNFSRDANIQAKPKTILFRRNSTVYHKLLDINT